MVSPELGTWRVADPPPLPSCHASPRFHIFSAFLMGDHQAGIQQPSLWLSRCSWVLGERFNIAFMATPPSCSLFGTAFRARAWRTSSDTKPQGASLSSSLQAEGDRKARMAGGHGSIKPITAIKNSKLVSTRSETAVPVVTICIKSKPTIDSDLEFRRLQYLARKREDIELSLNHG